MRLVYRWLCDLVDVPGDPERLATTLGLRGFEVASIEGGAQPVIDLEITANRPDCLSMVGLAREAAAAYDLPLRLPERVLPHAGDADPIEVGIDAPDLCPRYCAQVFRVSVGLSPEWMQQRLQAGGIRPINNIVDVTNYVMLEMGQPMHAFDVARLGGRALRIRRARAGESIRTLDGVSRALAPDTLVIADAARPQAVGGVMGGADSEIGAGTTTIVLESAYFAPAAVRRTSKRLALKTEASIRFERGADIEAPPIGIARAARLLVEMGAGEPLGPMVDRYPAPREPLTLTLRAARIRRVLGADVPAADVPRMLAPLGFGVREVAAPEAGWRVRVPAFRVDVQREIDLVEEVARHHGYDKLPATFPALAVPQPPPDERTVADRTVRRILTACGFSEAMTFAFVERDLAAAFADGVELVALANPLSETFAMLRPSLLGGLVDACGYNRRRERRDVRLFEVGTRFSSTGETRGVALAWSGGAAAPHWSGGARAVDFFDVKGSVETLGHAFGVDLVLADGGPGYFVDGHRAIIHAARPSGELVAVGAMGQIVPQVLEARGLPAGDDVLAAELDLDLLRMLAPNGELRAEPLPRFPTIVRDLSILIEDRLPAAAVRGTIRSTAPSTLVQVVEFDRYRGKGVPDGRISLSLRLTFRSPERTLTDAEVEAAMDSIVAALVATHGAQRR